jgi:hypothetical protein
MYYFVHPGIWGILFGWLFPVLFIAVIIGCLIWAFGSDGPHATSSGYVTRRDAAVEAARYRYAQGLLSRDEYRHLMADLGVPLPGDPPPPPPWPDAPSPAAARTGPGASTGEPPTTPVSSS